MIRLAPKPLAEKLIFCPQEPLLDHTLWMILIKSPLLFISLHWTLPFSSKATDFRLGSGPATGEANRKEEYCSSSATPVYIG